VAFTFFFRDAQTIELAIEEALPGLLGRAFIHVWSAGCAHGPEPYTLAILLRKRLSDYIFRNVRIHATDVDPSFASHVNKGVFPEKELQRIPPAILQQHFRPASAAGFVEVVPELLAKVTFTHHDLLSLQPIREGLSLIVCKNVLLHFDEGQRMGVLRMFHQALQPGGTLVMEHTQKLPDALAPLFRQVVPYAQVFRKAEPSFVAHPAEEVVSGRHSHRRTMGVGIANSPGRPTDGRERRASATDLRSAPGDGSFAQLDRPCESLRTV